jgi:hypothetical protein
MYKAPTRRKSNDATTGLEESLALSQMLSSARATVTKVASETTERFADDIPISDETPPIVEEVPPVEEVDIYTYTYIEIYISICIYIRIYINIYIFCVHI